MTVHGMGPICKLVAAKSKQALPIRKHKKLRLPLCCWMRSARPLDGSRIRSLVERGESVRWGFQSYGSGVYHLADRIAKKWGVTHLQHQILTNYLDRFFDGRASERVDCSIAGKYGNPRHMPESPASRYRLAEFNGAVIDAFRANGITLRALLSKELTALILINQTRIIL